MYLFLSLAKHTLYSVQAIIMRWESKKKQAELKSFPVLALENIGVFDVNQACLEDRATHVGVKSKATKMLTGKKVAL